MAGLTPAERERLIKLNEELAEASERLGLLQQAMGKAQQTLSKALLHGYEVSFQGIDYQNRADLVRELGDVEAAIDLMANAGDVDREQIAIHQRVKLAKITRYMQHQNGQT